MNSKITFSLSQKKGVQNAVRIFFDDELLDEFETTIEKTYYYYDHDIEPGKVYNIIIQVLNHKTIIDDKVNILASNSVVIDDFFISYNETVSQNLNYQFSYIRKIDPIYEIYAKQKNIDYKKIELRQYCSNGEGLFHLPIVAVKYWSPKIDNLKVQFLDDILGFEDRGEEWYKLEQGQIIKKNFNVFDSTAEQFKFSKEEIVDIVFDRLLQYDNSFKSEKCEPMYKNPDLVEQTKINIRNGLDLYEN